MANFCSAYYHKSAYRIFSLIKRMPVFMLVMKDKIVRQNGKSILHTVYEGQNRGNVNYFV
ncbi:hypothetical protein CVD19_24150 [Bacillus sp. T33-2]|nr:hypothetical protein CVD19_24150 [Bacillus sp. T33-2]